MNGNSVKCIDEDQNGNLYIGTDNGLYRMAMNNSLEHFVHDSRNGAKSLTIPLDYKGTSPTRPVGLPPGIQVPRLNFSGSI